MTEDEVNDWTVSFNPNQPRPPDEDDLLEQLRPLVVGITRFSDDRFEAALNDALPDRGDMSDVFVDFCARLSEILPGAYVVGHLEKDSS